MKILLTSNYNKTAYPQTGFLVISKENYELFLDKVTRAFEALDNFNQERKRKINLIIPGTHDWQDAPFKSKEDYLSYLKVKEITEEEFNTLSKLFGTQESTLELYDKDSFGEIVG